MFGESGIELRMNVAQGFSCFSWSVPSAILGISAIVRLKTTLILQVIAAAVVFRVPTHIDSTLKAKVYHVRAYVDRRGGVSESIVSWQHSC